MLETPHTKEYYLAKAEEHPFLKKILEDKDSFEGRLESMLTYQGNEQEWFHEYLGTLKDVATASEDWEELGRRYDALNWGNFVYAGAAFSKSAVIIGGIFLVFPPFALLEPVLLGLGTSGYLHSRKKMKYQNETFDEKETIFAPLRSAARTCDLDIGRCFLYENFIEEGSRHDRFEKTYTCLEPGERAEVQRTLRGMLSAGVLDMSELGLEKYLESLTEQQR